VRWLVIGSYDDRLSAHSADLSAFLFPDDNAATRNVAPIGYRLDFINGHEPSPGAAADSSVLLGRGNAVTMESVERCDYPTLPTVSCILRFEA
jgi:hypothetical protein